LEFIVIGLKDAEWVPSSALVGVVMLEVNLSPEAKVFVISGYPRHMDDVMEYTQKVYTEHSFAQNSNSNHNKKEEDYLTNVAYSFLPYCIPHRSFGSMEPFLSIGIKAI
jgi:hypothetical protein